MEFEILISFELNIILKKKQPLAVSILAKNDLNDLNGESHFFHFAKINFNELLIFED